MMDQGKDVIDRTIESFRTHGVLGLVAMLTIGLGMGVASWVVLERTHDTMTVSQSSGALTLAGLPPEIEPEEALVPSPDEGAVADQIPPYVPPPEGTPQARVELIGDDVVVVAVGDSYTDDGAVAFDPDENALPFRIYVNGMLTETVVVDTSVQGTHEIEYRAQIDAGDFISATRVVVVE